MKLDFEIATQPDDTTCGPTCLHAVYRYFGNPIPLEQVISQVTKLSEGGTLAVLLGCDALRRGFRATIYTYNLQVFDPTWFSNQVLLSDKLTAQAAVKKDAKLTVATRGYLDFLDKGGEISFQDLTPKLIRYYLKRSIPILTGLSATYLYRSARECVPNSKEDDVAGFPAGHFVVLCGYDMQERQVRIADPYLPNPMAAKKYYGVAMDRLICSIMLGILTYDANLLVIEPARSLKGRRDGISGHR
jgi:hypothetical protein